MTNDNERIYVVYMHRNKINGKVYIGMTKNLKQRWASRGVHYSKKDAHTKAFARALEKYTWDGFDHVVLFENLTFEEANAKEVELIAYYKSNVHRYSNPTYGYNLTDGGQGVAGHRWTEEEKLEISRRITGSGNPMYGKKHSDYTKALISKANKGRFSDGKSPLLGRKMSAEARQKMSDNHHDVSGGKNPRAVSVMCIETGEIFETQTAAGDAFGVSRSAIARACKRGTAICTGQHFNCA